MVYFLKQKPVLKNKLVKKLKKVLLSNGDINSSPLISCQKKGAFARMHPMSSDVSSVITPYHQEYHRHQQRQQEPLLASLRERLFE